MNFNRNTCKVPVTHNRLLEAHYLWHQAALCYHDPFRFRTHMNALIQALRNITFALQNEKDKSLVLKYGTRIGQTESKGMRYYHG